MYWSLIFFICVFACAIDALPQQSGIIDPADPGLSDPTVLPDKDFTLLEPRTPEPFKDGIPILPDACDPAELLEDCFKALEKDKQGAYLWFDKDHSEILGSHQACW